MEKRNRDGWRADERYYNRGQTEDALDREGRAFVSSFWNEPYSPEINPVMGLTAYEMCRPPVPLPNRQIELDLKSAKLDFSCPICLSLVNDTFATMECMHRFCNTCIATSLRMGAKECPTCRMKLPSKRNLRKDEAFDRLVAAVFDVNEMDVQEDQETAKIARSFDRSSMKRIVDEGLARQARSAPPPPAMQREEEEDDDDDDDDEEEEEEQVSRVPAKRAHAVPAAPPRVLPTPKKSAESKPGRAEVLLVRNPNEIAMKDLILPAVILPRSVPLSAVVFVLQRLTAGAPQVVLSIVPPGSAHPVLLQEEKTVADIQHEYFKNTSARLTLQFQTQRLAAAMVTTTK